ncbi:MAG: hypothetical protein HYT72_01980 [Candidatus Aenigmarchaeota archaeon]|nr:hypothetical protein [Candidatus Aenigmarchaeota archaeon]
MALDMNKIQMILQELVRRTNDELLRVRNLEDRIQSLEERTSSIEELSLERTRKANDKFAELDVSIRNMSDEIVRLKNTVEKIGRQIDKFALKRDIKEVEKMFDLLSPVKQEYVTKEELGEVAR